jgi:CBS domain-containing protein
MIAADIMTHPALAIDPDAPLAQAIRLMTTHKLSGLPVVEQDGQLVGMLTEGDLLRRVETGTEGDRPGWLASFLMPGREASRYVRTHGRKISEVMTSGVISAAEATPLAELVTLMQRHHVKRIPVVREGRLVGIVSRADLVRQIGKALSAELVSADDETILKGILDAMGKEPWIRGDRVSVAVQAGVVALDGCLFDMRERDAVGVLAETIPGVQRVENRIICIEPYMGMITYDPASGAGNPRGQARQAV